MSLKFTYSFIAIFYDVMLEKASAHIRSKSINDIRSFEGKRTLVTGIGTGLDIPFLPKKEDITGIDITPAMLKKAQKRAALHECKIQLDEGDAMALPYKDESYDIVIMHLILAVVPDSYKAISEANRVLKKGGTLIIFDKFLKPGEAAPVKRLINVLFRHIATKTNVVLEPLLESQPALKKLSDVPVLANGWFRRIECQKDA
jgi:ubiquinone/menaquinone biosynthesis C-methylase UbiE